MHAPRRFRQLLAVSIFLLSCAADAATSSGASLFQRRQLNPDGTLRGSSLALSAGGTTKVLTPAVPGTYDGGANWSPHGTWFVFQRGIRTTAPQVRYDVFVMERSGGNLRQLTHGPGSFETPVWGPDARIAFVSKRQDQDCLSVVDADGRHHRDLFCAPDAARLARPQWSRDGRTLYVAGGYYTGKLEQAWHAVAWRVDAATGAARSLTEITMDEARELAISPDGRHGIFSDVVPNELTMIDFATQTMTPVGTGYAPRWSRDGRHVAFTGEVYEFSPGLLYYNPLFVMDADGRNVRRITHARLDNVAYTAVDWSDDGTHVLANVRTYDDPSLTLPRYGLRWIEVDNGALSVLPAGYADEGGWFIR